jgi:hypothetical protein
VRFRRPALAKHAEFSEIISNVVIELLSSIFGFLPGNLTVTAIEHDGIDHPDRRNKSSHKKNSAHRSYTSLNDARRREPRGVLWYLRFYHVGMIWSAGLVQPTLKVRAYVQRAAGRQLKESPPASALRVAAATSPVRARRVPALLGFPIQGRAARFPLGAETRC